MNKLASPVFLAIGLIFAALGPLALPNLQGGGGQQTVWAGQVITTTATTSVVPCNQGENDIGRKTLSVHNETGYAAVTVTAQLRESPAWDNFTTGYLAANNVAAGSAGFDVALPTEAGGRYCQLSAISAVSSTITVTLRRE
jgi:hypothetical protein